MVLIIMPLVIIGVVGGATQRFFSGDARSGGAPVSVLIQTSDESPQTQAFAEALNRQTLLAPVTSNADSDSKSATRVAAVLTVSKDFPNHVESFCRLDRAAMLESWQSQTPEQRLRAFGVQSALVQDNDSSDAVLNVLHLAAADALLQSLPVSDAAGNRAERPDLSGVPAAVSGSRTAQSPGGGYRFVVPSYTVLFVFFLVNFMGRSIILEREQGTLRRLQIAPISPAAVILGKMLPFWLLSVGQTAILLLSGRFLFGMPLGPQPWLLIPVILFSSLAATTAGLLFATCVRSEPQVSAWGNLVVLGTAGLSGCLVPRRWMPEFARHMSLITPHAWALDAFQEILAETDIRTSVVWGSCCALALFSGVFFAAGYLRFRFSSD